jgi:hypothetical protein
VPGFRSSRPNWVPPLPHQQASVAPPPIWVQGGRHISLAGGGGDPIPTKEQTLRYFMNTKIPPRAVPYPSRPILFFYIFFACSHIVFFACYHPYCLLSCNSNCPYCLFSSFSVMFFSCFRCTICSSWHCPQCLFYPLSIYPFCKCLSKFLYSMPRCSACMASSVLSLFEMYCRGLPIQYVILL